VPLLLLPLVLLLFVAGLVLLIPISLFMRYRRGTARQEARGWVAMLNLVTLTISAALLLTTAALTSFWVPRAFPYTAAGLAAGGVVGLVGLWATRWEPSTQALHHTPNRWLVLLIMVVVASRLVYGVWRAWHAWLWRSPQTPWLASAGVAGSMAAGAAVIGYYIVYWAGVRRRLRHHRRTSGVIDVPATRVPS
jgi:hypothetical protein